MKDCSKEGEQLIKEYKRLSNIYLKSQVDFEIEAKKMIEETLNCGSRFK